VERIELEVLAANDVGRSFYRKQRFQLVRTEDVTLGEETVTQHVMVKQL
jgi:ribosomal protein S18 acetylase RimI-like enzyme